MRLSRFVPLMFLSLLMLLLAVGLWTQISKASGRQEVTVQGLPQINLPDLHNPEKTMLSENMKGEPFLLNFFASWCANCHIEHEPLKQITEQTGIPIYGIVWRDEAQSARNWLVEKGNFYRQVGFDEKSIAAIEIGLTGIPETYFIAADGTVAGAHRGPVNQQVYEYWLLPLLKKHGFHAAE